MSNRRHLDNAPGALPTQTAKLRLELVSDQAGTWTLMETSTSDGVIVATGPPHTKDMIAAIIRERLTPPRRPERPAAGLVIPHD